MRHAPGFTLVEMLVALVLLGLMSVLMSGVLRFGARAWEAAATTGADAHRTVMVQGVLARLIDRAVVPEPVREGATPAAFAGDAGGMRFVALPPPHLGPGMHRVEVRVAETGGGRDLVLAWRPLLGEEEAGSGGWTERVLIEDVGEAAFAFLAPAGGEEGSAGRWLSEWQGRDGLPALVTLDLAFAEGDRRVWPEFAAAPRVQVTGEPGMTTDGSLRDAATGGGPR